MTASPNRVLALAVIVSLVPKWAAADEPKAAFSKAELAELAKQVADGRERGLVWLEKNQNADGSWGKSYTIGVTGMGCLAFLSATDEPFIGKRGGVLLKGLDYLMANQQDGLFPTQGQSVRTWSHGQGFASLALSEAYGRSLLCEHAADLDIEKVKGVLEKSVAAITKHQSTNGGWPYLPNQPGSDEGATTVCAVQALVSAKNYGIDIDPKVLDRGFEYLRKSQNPDGSFQYIQGSPGSMKGGTAADVATLGLMQRFDFPAMISGYEFLVKFSPDKMNAPHQPWYFPYYGNFYGCMGMRLLDQEYGEVKEFHDNTTAYIAGTQKHMVAWQKEDGSWPNVGWIADQEKGETDAYATAFATMTLFIPEGRISVYNREPPKLPKK